jgi:hypothetical protein
MMLLCSKKENTCSPKFGNNDARPSSEMPRKNVSWVGYGGFGGSEEGPRWLERKMFAGLLKDFEFLHK